MTPDEARAELHRLAGLICDSSDRGLVRMWLAVSTSPSAHFLATEAAIDGFRSVLREAEAASRGSVGRES